MVRVVYGVFGSKHFVLPSPSGDSIRRILYGVPCKCAGFRALHIPNSRGPQNTDTSAEGRIRISLAQVETNVRMMSVLRVVRLLRLVRLIRLLRIFRELCARDGLKGACTGV